MAHTQKDKVVFYSLKNEGSQSRTSLVLQKKNEEIGEELARIFDACERPDAADRLRAGQSDEMVTITFDDPQLIGFARSLEARLRELALETNKSFTFVIGDGGRGQFVRQKDIRGGMRKIGGLGAIYAKLTTYSSLVKDRAVIDCTAFLEDFFQLPWIHHHRSHKA